MKIEKIDNNKIRCFLDREDLLERHISLTELAYGTDKAKSLFNEMLEEASEEFGFECEGSPIMVEAIPISSDSIILTISKVEDPEELDTRFSRFTPPSDDSDIDDFSSLLPKLLDGLDELDSELDSEIDDSILDENTAPVVTQPDEDVRIFKFKNIDDISVAARAITNSCDINSSVYFNSSDKHYYLVTSNAASPKEDYIRITNTLSEFGVRIKATNATAAFYEESLECIIEKNALDVCRAL